MWRAVARIAGECRGMMSRWGFVPFVAMLLCLAAAVISDQLLLKHVTGSAEAKWFDAGCGEQAEGRAADCAAVLASPYSYFPPKRGEQPDGRPHVPVALLGLFYYSALFVWLLGVGRPTHDRRRWHWLPVALIAIGLIASAYFIVVMSTVIGEWCPWCLATHVINVLIALCFVLMWPRAPGALIDKGGAAPDRAEPGVTATASPPVAIRSHPTGRAVWTTLFAVLAVGYAELSMVGLETWKKNAQSYAGNLERCVAEVTRLTDDAARFVHQWEANPRFDLPIGADDPARVGVGASGPTLDVVVFSDFECPSCQRFALFMEEQGERLFGGHLRTVFKDYPLNRACNPEVATTMHPQACFAARIAQAAMVVGGNDAFWRAHDYLFHDHAALKQGRITPAVLAAAIGVDADALERAAESDGVAARIRSDIELAHKSAVRSTPAVFVAGRRIDTLAARKIEFWDVLAERFWKGAGVQRPAATRMTQSKTTPDTPGPTGDR
jgi:uncharacterized membrane protein